MFKSYYISVLLAFLIISSSFGSETELNHNKNIFILNSLDPATIQVAARFCNENNIWLVLKRSSIADSEGLPVESTMLSKEISLFERNESIIFTGIAVIILQTILIIRLAWSRRKQKNLTEQIVKLDKRYLELYREERIIRLSRLIASISHEINQPLTAILSVSQAGIKYIDLNKSDSALLKEILQKIAEIDKRAASVISSLRSSVKLEKRRKSRTDLNKIVLDVVDFYKSNAIKPENEIYVKLPDDPVFVVVDSIQIQQVIINFISNAIKSMETKSINDKLIVITESLTDDEVWVSVRDYGTGIDESVKSNLFEPLVTSGKDGLALGLAVSRYIIEDHQGEILAENMPDGGAKFSFKLKVYND